MTQLCITNFDWKLEDEIIVIPLRRQGVKQRCSNETYLENWSLCWDGWFGRAVVETRMEFSLMSIRSRMVQVNILRFACKTKEKKQMDYKCHWDECEWAVCRLFVETKSCYAFAGYQLMAKRLSASWANNLVTYKVCDGSFHYISNAFNWMKLAIRRDSL